MLRVLLGLAGAIVLVAAIALAEPTPLVPIDLRVELEEPLDSTFTVRIREPGSTDANFIRTCWSGEACVMQLRLGRGYHLSGSNGKSKSVVALPK